MEGEQKQEEPLKKSTIDQMYGYEEEQEEEKDEGFLDLISKALDKKKERAFKPLRKTV